MNRQNYVEIESLAHRESADITKLWQWSPIAVRCWLRDTNMQSVNDIIDIRNGIHLIRCNIDYIRKYYGGTAVARLNRLNFFEKLITLKIRSRQILTVLANCYIDDYLVYMPPQRIFAEDVLQKLSEHYRYTGFIENEEKKEGPETSMIHLGIQPDTTDVSVQHPLRKRNEVTELAYKVLFHKGYTIPQHETLLGKCEHMAEYAWPGKAFVVRMRIQNTFIVEKFGRDPNIWVSLPDWEEKDILWWIEYAESVSKVSIIHLLDTSLPNTQIFFDGATNGAKPNWEPRIGVWFQGAYIEMDVPERYRTVCVSEIDDTPKEQAIAQFEALAIVVGLDSMADLIGTHQKLLLRTDSKHVEAAFVNKRTPDPFLMACVRWPLMQAAKQAWRLYVLYVNTKSNRWADAASRIPKQNDADWKIAARIECENRGWTFRKIEHPTIPDLTQW